MALIAAAGAALLVGCPFLDRGQERRVPDTRRHTKAKAKAKPKKPGKLQTLPYLNWVPIQKRDRGKLGVMQQNPRLVSPGVNFYNSRPRSKALLLDMNGKQLHSWSSVVGQPTAEEMAWTKLWPHLADFKGWHHVELLPKGAIFAVNCYGSLLKLDRASKVLWRAPVAAHHDVAVAPNGTIYTLASVKRAIKRKARTLQLLDNQIVVLSPKGAVLRRISLFDALANSKSTALLLQKKLAWAEEHFANNFAFYHLSARLMLKPDKVDKLGRAVAQILAGEFKGSKRLELMIMTMLQPMDPLHANSVELLDRDLPIGRKGQLLISIRDLDLVAVLDPQRQRIGWSWGPGELDRQHQPTVLPSGNVLIFDNGPKTRRSRVIELDPRKSKIVWSYQGRPPRDFFSTVRGGSHHLPNSNILITDSERGRVIEVTRKGKVVWEFFNPDLKNPILKGARAPIYRMVRFPLDHVPGLGQGLGGAK
jgi:Arylsulfotransferase (ASST)